MIKVEDIEGVPVINLIGIPSKLSTSTAHSTTIHDAFGSNEPGESRGLSGVQYQQFAQPEHNRTQSELEHREDEAKRKQHPWRYGGNNSGRCR